MKPTKSMEHVEVLPRVGKKFENVMQIYPPIYSPMSHGATGKVLS